MNETEIDLSARIALHAFLIEQLLANEAMKTADPAGNWVEFSKQLMDSIRFKTTSPSDASELVDMHERMIAHAERLISRVSERISQGRR